MFSEGSIKDVIIKPLKKHKDDRGWLVELFREDEVDPEIMPVMSYISETLPGVARGPHEHVDQTDYFAFIGPSTFKLYLWDDRKNSPTYKNKMAFTAGVDEPMVVVIPPGIVHAYKNVGQDNGIVFNAPNRLFAGRHRKEQVDEIRHEDDPGSPFQLD